MRRNPVQAHSGENPKVSDEDKPYQKALECHATRIRAHLDAIDDDVRWFLTAAMMFSPAPPPPDGFVGKGIGELLEEKP